jgi:hypothetical protein
VLLAAMNVTIVVLPLIEMGLQYQLFVAEKDVPSLLTAWKAFFSRWCSGTSKYSS